ncbi:hypothetical protein [Fervidibacillus albus]|uniref:Uncharacterized protein n=1 Tax=Fervidibacillus albus TaxID=2980026 RepID=A0A9E8LWM2_9BACI|nr:hypothetical protein [Fervidibacillus albus]WAA11037.1 hypothetical protein OE104_06955 [Fervidibacillus albus]
MKKYKQMETKSKDNLKHKQDEGSMGVAMTYELVMDQYRKGTIDEWIQANENKEKKKEGDSK